MQASRLPTPLVAGATGNVGRYIMRALLDLDATVVVPSRFAERCAALRAETGDRGVNRILTINGDMGNEASAAELRDEWKAINRSLHAVVASLGRFAAAPSVLAAPLAHVHGVSNDYLQSNGEEQWKIARRMWQSSVPAPQGWRWQ